MQDEIGFDPFNHRLSRDIRNSLSSAFADTIRSPAAGTLEQCASDWLASGLSESMTAYINDRMQRYNRVLDQIRIDGMVDARHQALVAWNEQLYFEVHEILEDIWHPAKGRLRKALQGLILAAAMGEHLHYGHAAAVRRLAPKANRLLREHADQLDFIDNLDELLIWLQDKNRPAPVLRPK